jgi:hypothetical protein
MSTVGRTLRWAAIGGVAGGTLGYFGLMVYFRTFEFVPDSDSRAFQDFANAMGGGFCAIVGLILGVIFGMVWPSRGNNA